MFDVETEYRLAISEGALVPPELLKQKYSPEAWNAIHTYRELRRMWEGAPEEGRSIQPTFRKWLNRSTEVDIDRVLSSNQAMLDFHESPNDL